MDINFKYSFATTVFNDGKSITQFLTQLCEQTLKPMEIVIADGGSKDGTVEIIKKYASTCPITIKVLSGKRLNIAEGLNEAIKNCTADWIGLIGVGNSIDRTCFEALARNILSENAIAAYCPIRGMSTNTFQCLYKGAFLNGDNGNDLGIASNHGALIRKEILFKEGLFYEGFVYAGEDAELYGRIRKREYKTVCVKEAKTLWDTPHNLREYVKQRKWYKIADMQILSMQALLCAHGKSAVLCSLPFVGIVLVCIGAFQPIGMLLLVAFALYMAYDAIRRGIQVALLRLFARYLSLWQLIKYSKYMKRKYHIHRKDISV